MSNDNAAFKQDTLVDYVQSVRAEMDGGAGKLSDNDSQQVHDGAQSGNESGVNIGEGVRGGTGGVSAPPRHKHNGRCVGIEIQGVYDGILFYQCHDGHLRNARARKTYLFDRAEKEMRKWESRD